MFKKKKEQAPKAPEKTLQDLKQEFNSKLIEYGDFQYKDFLIRRGLEENAGKLKQLQRDLDYINQQARIAHQKAAAEVQATVDKGKPANEDTKVD